MHTLHNGDAIDAPAQSKVIHANLCMTSDQYKSICPRAVRVSALSGRTQSRPSVFDDEFDAARAWCLVIRGRTWSFTRTPPPPHLNNQLCPQPRESASKSKLIARKTIFFDDPSYERHMRGSHSARPLFRFIVGPFYSEDQRARHTHTHTICFMMWFDRFSNQGLCDFIIWRGGGHVMQHKYACNKSFRLPYFM